MGSVREHRGLEGDLYTLITDLFTLTTSPFTPTTDLFPTDLCLAIEGTTRHPAQRQPSVQSRPASHTFRCARRQQVLQHRREA